MVSQVHTKFLQFRTEHGFTPPSSSSFEMAQCMIRRAEGGLCGACER